MLSRQQRHVAPTTSPLIVSAQSAAATLLGESAPHVQTYGVIVAVTEQSYTNAPPCAAITSFRERL